MVPRRIQKILSGSLKKLHLKVKCEYSHHQLLQDSLKAEQKVAEIISQPYTRACRLNSLSHRGSIPRGRFLFDALTAFPGLAS